MLSVVVLNNEMSRWATSFRFSGEIGTQGMNVSTFRCHGETLLKLLVTFSRRHQGLCKEARRSSFSMEICGRTSWTSHIIIFSQRPVSQKRMFYEFDLEDVRVICRRSTAFAAFDVGYGQLEGACSRTRDLGRKC